MSIRISIIIPTYNRLELIKETISSLPLDDPRVEVIIVDDGSDDGTPEFLESHGGVTLLRQQNSGPGVARNTGAIQAKGEYLAFLDSDDFWLPWTLTTYLKVIEQTRAAFIAGKPLKAHSNDEVNVNHEGDLSLVAFADYLASGEEWRWWGCSSFLVRRDSFEAVGGFSSERINGEDADLALRLGEAGEFVQITSPHTFVYRIHSASEMANHDLTIEGGLHMLEQAKVNRYPGVSARAAEFWTIASRHLRPIAWQCLETGRSSKGWTLYSGLIRHELGTFRLKFIIGFPLHAFWKSIKRNLPPQVDES